MSSSSHLRGWFLSAITLTVRRSSVLLVEKEKFILARVYSVPSASGRPVSLLPWEGKLEAVCWS